MTSLPDARSSGPEVPFASDGPRTGDVIITQQRGREGEFLLRQLPHEAGVIVPSRGAALELAARFARSEGVGAWLSEAGVVTRLEHRRVPVVAQRPTKP